jgi:hypothetical protein
MRVQKKFIGGLIDKLKEKAGNLYDALFTKGALPTRFKKFLKQHGEERVESIVVYRSPLDSVANALLQVVSLGQWDEIRASGGHDKLFHLGIVINDKYTMEKLEKLEARTGNSVLQNREVKTLQVPITKDITINQLVGACAKKMGDKFTDYNAFSNNCQDFIISLLSASGLLSQRAREFIKQDLKKLIEATPSYMSYVAKGITDTARGAGNIYEAVVHRRGGPVRRFRPF